MKTNWKKLLTALALAAALLVAGCGGADAGQQADEGAAEPAAESSAAEENEGEDSVASVDEMTEVETVVQEWMVPVTGDQLKDGTYEISVDSSSSMFRIEDCTLTVADGKMTAVMTMGGTGYRYLYMGTGEEAAVSAEADRITPEETADGAHQFTVPVEALDQGIDCAAFSDRKEKWYERTLVFRADQIPAEAYRDGVLHTPDMLGDGTYAVDTALYGGSGRASVESGSLQK